MTPCHATTPAPARTGNGRQNFEKLGGRLGNFHSATRESAQLAQHDLAILRHSHLSELGDLLAQAGDLLSEAARRGSDRAIEAALRAARAIVLDGIACYRRRAG